MSWKNTPTRYGCLSIFMHWLMLILIVAVYACINLHEAFPKGSDAREALKTWHFMLGLSVFVLVWIRIIARLSGPRPAISPTPKPWQELFAKIVHLALYLFMIGMPIAGWLILSAAGKPIPFFGVELPALIAKNRDTAGMIKEVHETIGTLGYFLVGLHAAAALFHHYVLRDNTMGRILPGKEQ